MDTRLTALEDKVERRLHDTRPIWEQVSTRLTAIEERLTKVEERLTVIEERLTKVEERLTVVEGEMTKIGTRVKKVEDEVFMFRRKFDGWTGDLTLLQQRYEDLEERFEEFRSERSK